MSDQNKQKTIKKAGMSWITVWLIIIAVISLGVVVYATYTGVNIVKRVVSTKSGGGLLFSSNYMTTGTLTSIEYGNYSDYYDEENDRPLATNPEFSMNVCNFSQGDKATWYTSSDIKYNIKAELFLSERYTAEEAAAAGDPDLEGTFKTPAPADMTGKLFGIKFHNDNVYNYFSADNLTIDLPTTYILSKNDASTDLFDILIDKTELLNTSPKFWIKVTATPKSIVAGEVEKIDGYIGACKSATGEATWTGSIGDEDYDSIDYDAYNYIITGNGAGTFYFAWDDSKVKPNEFALLNYGSGTTPLESFNVSSWEGYKQYGSSGPSSVTGEDTWKYITLSVDSSVLPRYEFQLYKNSENNYSSVINKYVDYKFEADE